MKEDEFFVWMISATIAVIILFGGAAVYYHHEQNGTSCTAAQVGQVQVCSARENRVEFCDGVNWKPVHVAPVPGEKP